MGDQAINSSPCGPWLPVKSDGGGRLSKAPASCSHGSPPDLGFQFAFSTHEVPPR